MEKMLYFGKWFGILTILIALVAAAACSSPSTSTTATAPATSTASPIATNTSPVTSAASSATSTTTGQAVTIDLTAQNISFDKSTIRVPAGAQVTVNFTNKDSGITHNFAVYTDSTASTSIFVGKVVTGPGTATYTFTAPSKPGTYFFRCDIHPTIMTGSFVVQ